MPGLNDLLVNIATDARLAKDFRTHPSRVIERAGLSGVEESVLLSRDARLIQSALQSAALKDSLAAADDTVWTVIVVL